ncbi:MAG: DUF885 domain-containing protein [Gammaproteobacteria bacterium]|nr:DUF885 domain-containing protein [Gammaproteobacteria bacterium]
MKRNLVAMLVIAGLTACTTNTVSTDHNLVETETSFAVTANQVWAEAEKIQQQGVDELPDMSEAALAKAQQQRLALLQQLQNIEVTKLSDQDQINHTILVYRLQNDVDEYRFGAHYMPLNAESGFHSDVLFMLNGQSVTNEATARSYLKKLAGVGHYIDQQMHWMQLGLAKGYTQPKAVLAGYQDGIRSFISANAADSAFYRPFLTQPTGVDAKVWQQLQQEAAKLIGAQVTPAYQRYYDFFVNQYLPGARDSIAATDLPDGAAYYQNRLEYYTTLKLSPQQVHEIGLQEVARIRQEMQQVIDQTGFKGDFAQFVQFLRTDKQFYVNTPEQLLKEAAYLSKKIDAQLPKLFKTLPRTPYGVEPVPAQIAPKYTTGRYAGGNGNGEPGFYWVNTYALDRRPLYELEALTLHEAVPGHHLQISIANEQTALPAYRRSFYTSAFGEGWGLYSEYLGLEVGFYQDPYSNFGRLTYEMWRACRLVVDTGMHTMGWSRQQAIDYLAGNTALSMHNVTTEVDRYISWPAQALSYKLGEITIKRLRKQAEQQLGDKFDVRTFHDAVLENGSLPLSALEQQVNLFIKKQQAK